MNADWRQDAACADKPPKYWFEPLFYGIGRAICDDCAVRSACLDYALTNRIWHGMWAGLSERERVRVVRKRRQVETGRRAS